MVLWCSFRERLLALCGSWGCPPLCSPCLWLGPLLPLGYRTGTCWPWCCTECQRSCFMLLDVSPVLHNCSSEVTKTRALPADSMLQSNATIVGLSRKEKSCLGVSKVKTGSRRMLLRDNKQKLHIYMEQKLESSRNSPSCFRIQSIFSLAHMGWASASFLPQTVLLLAVLRQKQDSQCSKSYTD